MAPDTANECPHCGTSLSAAPGNAPEGTVPVQQPGTATGNFTPYQQPGNATGNYGVYQQPTAAQGSYAAYQQQNQAPKEPPAFQTGGVPGFGQTGSSASRRRKAAPLIHPSDAAAAYPARVLRSLQDPAGLLRELMTTRDSLTCLIACGVMALVVFLCGLFVTHRSISSLTALQWFSMSNRLWAISASVGGIALLCWVLSSLLKTGIYLFYLCVLRKIAFTWEMALGFLGVPTLSEAGFALIGLILSLIYPLAGLPLFLMAGPVCLMQYGAMTAAADGVTLEQSFRPRLILACIAVFAQVLVVLILGGGLGGNILVELGGNLV